MLLSLCLVLVLVD